MGSIRRLWDRDRIISSSRAIQNRYSGGADRLAVKRNEQRVGLVVHEHLRPSREIDEGFRRLHHQSRR